MRAIPQEERPGVELNTNNVIKLKRKRIKKRNPLWIIAGLLAAILIAVLVILVRGGAEGIAETGSVTVDVDYNAVIVRNEKVITSEAFDLADYFAEEGAWVEPDTKINADLSPRIQRGTGSCAYAQTCRNLRRTACTAR